MTHTIVNLHVSEITAQAAQNVSDRICLHYRLLTKPSQKVSPDAAQGTELTVFFWGDNPTQVADNMAKLIASLQEGLDTYKARFDVHDTPPETTDDTPDLDTLPTEDDQEWFDDRTGYLDYRAEQAREDEEDEWPRREAFTGRALENAMDTTTYCITCRQPNGRHVGHGPPAGERVISEGYITPDDRLVLDF